MTMPHAAASLSRASAGPFAMAAPIARTGGSGYRMAAKGGAGEIYLYGPIGQDWFGDGVTAKQFADDLKALGAVTTIDLRINSEGGDVFAGQAMYSLLTQHNAKVACHIDGLAASAASFVAMAGDTIEIAEGGFLMVHNAWTICMGDADALEKQATMLRAVNGTIAAIYVARTKNKVADVKAWMDAETWFSGADAVKNGFADRIIENMKVAAAVRDPARFKNLPATLRPNRAAALRLISR